MVEDSLKKLYDHNYIGENLDNIIEAFVSFYGEQAREYITNRFRNTTIITYYNTDDFRDNIDNVKKSLLKEVFSINMDKAIFTNVDDFYKDCTQYTDDELFVMEYDELKEIFDGDTDKELIKEKIKNHSYPKVLEFIRRYQELKPILAPFEEECEKEEEREKQINKKYYRILLNDFKYLLSDEDIKTYETLGIPSRLTRLYLGGSVAADYYCFDEESEDILDDPEESEWKKQNITRDRIKFFIEKGIDLTNDPNFKLNPPTYDDYLKDERVQKLIKESIKIGKKIQKRKKELNKKRINEILNGRKKYLDSKKEIDDLNLINKDVPIAPSIYLNECSCFSENYQVIGNSIVPHPIIILLLDNMDMDRTLIHELNHDYEQHDIMVNKDGCQSISGWDFTEIKFFSIQNEDTEAYDGQTRTYELLNEYVNEKIAIEITKILHNNGNYIYCHNINEKGSAYMIMDFLLVDFYETFKPIIVESRSHGNIGYIYEKLGKENFEKLNDLVNEFSEKYGIGIEANSAVQEYLDKSDSQITYDIKKFVDKKNKIMSQMKEHLESKNITL